LISAASCVVTLIAQRSGGALQGVQNVPISYRLSNAVVAYAVYALSLVWPSGLAVYYPYPAEGRQALQVLGARLLLAGLTYFFAREARHRAYLLTGWLWYLGTMVRVIGLLQVGGQ